jgi:hypothetical protein
LLVYGALFLPLSACTHSNVQHPPTPAVQASTQRAPLVPDPVPGPSASTPEPGVETLELELEPFAAPLAPPGLAALDWKHALTLAESTPNQTGKPVASSPRPRVAELERTLVINVRVQPPVRLWAMLDGFTPRALQTSGQVSTYTLAAFVPELSKLTPGVHRLLWFAGDASGRAFVGSDGAPLAGSLAFEFQTPGAAPVGASVFFERAHAPLLFGPRGTFNHTDERGGLPLELWHSSAEQAFLLRIEAPGRAQGFLRLTRGSYTLFGLGSGDHLLSLVAEGGSNAEEWTITVNRDLDEARSTTGKAAPLPKEP